MRSWVQNSVLNRVAGFLTLFGLVSDPDLQKTREKVINEERLGAEG